MLEFLAAAVEHAEPTAFGIPPGGYVALATICVLLIMLWKRVPRAIAHGLDARIEGIRKQLEEAKLLRVEAEKLRDEYAKKAREADEEIAALRAGASRQADEIVEKAKADAAALIERHKAIAADKIAAAERTAVEQLRTKAAEGAAIAARAMIADRHDAEADCTLVDQAISSI